MDIAEAEALQEVSGTPKDAWQETPGILTMLVDITLKSFDLETSQCCPKPSAS